MLKVSTGRKAFVFFNTTGMLLYSFICILPFVYLLSLSFSSKNAAAAGLVGLWPVEFTTKSYGFVLNKPEFIGSIFIAFQRVFLGMAVNMFMVIITAYPLSKETKDFKFRTFFVWFFVFTMLFSGGLIPSYIVVQKAGLINSIWSLIIPGALPVFNMILLLNFFRGLPKELDESAFIDGANHWIVLFKIYIPLSLPALATILLFTIVGHWNSWFDGLIYMTQQKKYPLSTYLQSIVISADMVITNEATARAFAAISDRTVRAAQIFIGALPVLIVYPFLQKYFITGLVLGSVKE